MAGYTFGDLARYEILELFAVGGAAELYRARDRATGTIVVIKRMRADLDFDPTVAAGFEREVQIAMRSHHKNLVRGLDKGMHQGLDWVVLEFIDGKDLAQVIARARETDTPLPLEISVYVIREILEGLSFAQNMKDALGQPMGLVHRDINPRNILIGYDGVVRVADFGSAIASMSEPEPDEVVGSPGYLAPEQARLTLLDASSDLFAVGCILYELALPTPAFATEGLSDAELLEIHRAGVVLPVPEDVSGFVARLLARSCAPEREQRFPDATTMLNAIEDMRPPRPLEDLQAALGAMMRKEFGRTP